MEKKVTEIKEGMYARTRLGIGKIFSVGNNYVGVQFSKYNTIAFPNVDFNVKKASYDIIDLIEVGDYVNGQYVCEKFYDYANEEWNIIIVTTQHLKFGENRNDIKSIVTKEQFENMKYEAENE